jgi:hypothetical protein
MGAFDEFYSGAMAPPTKVGGNLVPSLVDMYRENAPGTGGGLTTRKVQTVDIDEITGNPIPSGGTTYFPKGPTYGYNALTGDYEIQQPGNAYAAGGGKPNFNYAPGVQAIGNAAPDLASLFANMGGRGSAGFTGPNTMPVDSDVPLNRGGGLGGSRGAPAPLAPPPPPKTPLQSLADMFTPAPVSRTPRQSMNIARQTNDIWKYGAGGTPDTKAETRDQTIARVGHDPFLQNVGDHGAGSSDVAREF